MLSPLLLHLHPQLQFNFDRKYSIAMSNSTPPKSHNHKPTNESENETKRPTSDIIKKPAFLAQRPPKPTWVLPHRTPTLESLYTKGKKLGQGQFGVTFLCTEKSSCILYACKSIPKKKLICAEDYDDVWREIQIMHHLSENPNVVRIKGTFEDAGSVHIVMELCAGGELFDRIIRKGHYSEKEAAKLIKTIVGVVEACHSLGLCIGILSLRISCFLLLMTMLLSKQLILVSLSFISQAIHGLLTTPYPQISLLILQFYRASSSFLR